MRAVAAGAAPETGRRARPIDGEDGTNSMLPGGPGDQGTLGPFCVHEVTGFSAPENIPFNPPGFCVKSFSCEGYSRKAAKKNRKVRHYQDRKQESASQEKRCLKNLRGPDFRLLS